MSLEIGLIFGFIALGIFFTFRVINFPDLTCDGSFVLGAAAACTLVSYGFNPYLATLVAMLAGALAGCLTGFLFLKLRVSDLLSGILVAFMLYSVNLRVMGGIPNIALLDKITIFSDLNSLVLLLILSLVIIAATAYLLLTDFGLALRSVGLNQILARSSGVNVAAMTLISLAVSNALIACGGAIFAQQQGFADIGSGIGTLVVGLAAVMIGEKLLPYRSMPLIILSCFIGSIAYRILISFALHMDFFGLKTQDINIITGLLIVAIMQFRRKNYAKTSKS